jgi:hypothetical protein
MVRIKLQPETEQALRFGISGLLHDKAYAAFNASERDDVARIGREGVQVTAFRALGNGLPTGIIQHSFH